MTRETQRQSTCTYWGEKASDHNIVYMSTALERDVFVLVSLVADLKTLEIFMILCLLMSVFMDIDNSLLVRLRLDGLSASLSATVSSKPITSLKKRKALGNQGYEKKYMRSCWSYS